MRKTNELVRFQQMAAMKQRVKNVKGSEYFPYPLYIYCGITMGQLAEGCGVRVEVWLDYFFSFSKLRTLSDKAGHSELLVDSPPLSGSLRERAHQPRRAPQQPHT